jgi:hypothetical protein
VVKGKRQHPAYYELEKGKIAKTFTHVCLNAVPQTVSTFPKL